jgi:lipid-A-disaccharide synthase
LLLCILPFEPTYFEKYGLKAKFIGHPLFFGETGYSNIYNPNSEIISITVGSRKGEVKRFLPIIMNVIKKLRKSFNFTYYFLATESTFSMIKNKIKGDDLKVVLNEMEKKEIMKKSLVGITKSGTNTLEFTATKIPQIIYYRFNFLTNLLARFLRKISNTKFVNLVNILAKEEIIKELVLEKCNEKNIYDATKDLIDNNEKRVEQVVRAGEVLKMLGFQNENTIIDEIVK